MLVLTIGETLLLLNALLLLLNLGGARAWLVAVSLGQGVVGVALGAALLGVVVHGGCLVLQRLHASRIYIIVPLGRYHK